jgi:hypothetical protein
VRWASTPLPGPGRMLVAVGDPARVGAVLDRYAAVANPAPGTAVAQSS